MALPGSKYSFAYASPIITSRKSFEAGEPVRLDLNKTVDSYTNIYGLDSNYVFAPPDNATYIYGEENSKKYRDSLKNELEPN